MRWVIYTIVILVCSTQYFEMGVYIALFTAVIMPTRVNMSVRWLLVRESVLYVFVMMIYYAGCSWYIISDPESFFSLPVSVAFLFLLVPFLPDFVRMEIDSYHDRL